MSRALRIAIVVALSPLAGCAMFSKTDNAPKMASLVEVPNAVPARLVWQASIGTSGPNPLSPALSGSSVFAAGRDGALARFDAASGAQVWRVQTGKTITGGVGSDGKRVVVGDAKGLVLAYDADGKPLWTAQVSSEVLAAPAVADSLVVVRAGDNRIFGLDAATGRRLWVVQRASPTLVARSSAGAVISGSTVYVGFAGGKLAAIDALNGATRWEATVSIPKGATELERISDVTSPPVVAGGRVCAVAFQGRLSCFEVGNGNQVWSRDVSSTSGLAVDVRYVFVADDKGAVHAFDRVTGASIWKQDKLAYRQLSAPVSHGRFVAVADVQGYVHFLDREDGALLARMATDGSAVSAQMLGLDRVLLAQTRSGGLFAVTAQ